MKENDLRTVKKNYISLNRHLQTLVHKRFPQNYELESLDIPPVMIMELNTDDSQRSALYVYINIPTPLTYSVF